MDSESEYSDSSASNSSSSQSSSSESDDDSMEIAIMLGQKLRLPKLLCENQCVFKEFFSKETWDALPSNYQAFLKSNFLPTFPENNEIEQEKTLEMFFDQTLKRFGHSQLETVQDNLERGDYQPEIVRLRHMVDKSQRREQKFQEYERTSQLAKSLMIAREKVLRFAYDASPGTDIKVDRVVNSSYKLTDSSVVLRSRKRYYEEICNMMKNAGIDSISDDEIIPDEETLKSIQSITNIQVTPSNETKVIGTMCTKKPTNNLIVSIPGETQLNNDNLRQVLLMHKKRKLEEPDNPEFDTNDIRLRDVHARTQIVMGYRKSGVTSGRGLVGKKGNSMKSKSTNATNSSAANTSSKTDLTKIVEHGQLLEPINHIPQISTLQTPKLLNPDNNVPNNPPQQLLQNQLPSPQQQSQQILQPLTNNLPHLNHNCGFYPLLPQSPLPKPQSVITTISNQLTAITTTTVSSSSSSSSSSITSSSGTTAIASIAPVTPITTAPDKKQPTNSKINRGETKVRQNKRPNNQVSTTQSSSKKIILSLNGSNVPVPIANTSKIIDVTEQSTKATSPISLPQYHGKVKAATISDLEGIDMMRLPIDLDESGHIDILNDIKTEVGSVSSSELTQETYACYLSLIRDIFCSTQNHRMKLEDLKTKVHFLLANPITPLNDWYCQADNWLSLLPSAIHFLAGEFVDQPEDFVPYLEFKTQLNIYQWIGAGRDSDQHLVQLSKYWLSRKDDMGSKPLQKFEINSRKSNEFDESLLNERPASPPPPRCPTSWVVQPATISEINEFRKQERQRFENPHRAFTYRMHGYESVVGPVKGIYTQILALTKARGHNMLTADRPNFVTLLTLVRDATARLPNGEGTRADICELLKSSQYINPQAKDNMLQTIVSGALDRMHTEHDPCVRYDLKRKNWIYLHRNRTEEEFERLHQQYQGVGKHKKPTNRKVKTKQPKTTTNQSSTVPPSDNSPIPAVVVVPPSSNVSTIQKPLPALSSIQINSILQTPNTNSVVKPPPPLKIPPQKSLIKPELVPIKQEPMINTDKLENLEVESSLEVHTTPMVIQKPHQHPQHQNQQHTQSQQQQAQQQPQAPQQPQQHQQTNIQNLPTLVVESKPQKISPKKQASISTSTMTSSAAPTTQIKVSTPTGIQTVHVSTASLPVTGVNHPKQITSILASPGGQSFIVNQNQSTQNQIVVGNKKITKPILISQGPGSSLVSQVTPSGQGYVIPININNSEQLKAIPSMQSALVAASASNVGQKIVKSNQPPALTSTINTKPQIIQPTSKNFVRVSTTTSQTGKSLINPHVAATNITLQQQQKLLGSVVSVAASGTVQQKTITAGITGNTTVRPQMQKNANISMATNATTIKAHPSMTAAQQKQLLQNIINQQQQQQQTQQITHQQKQRTNAINVAGNTVVIPSGQAQTIQTKPVIISPSQVQQQIQKIINVSTAGVNTIPVVAGSGSISTANAGVNTANVVTTPPSGTSLISPQIIQIQHTGPHTGAKVQTLNTSNLTPQQQQSLLQSIKQQQLKQQQNASSNQQSIIIKQQPVFHTLQKQQQNISASNTMTVTAATASPKTVSSLIGTNVSNIIQTPTTLSSSTNVIQHHAQNIIKQQQQQQTQPQHQQQQQQQQQQQAQQQQSQQQQQQTQTVTGTVKQGTMNAQQQTIGRVIKSAGSIIHPQVITTTAGVRTQAGNPVMAKVLTNPSGQIISLESLLQKQGIAPGTTLRVAGAKPGQTSLIQLAGTPGSQITQYAVVSQGRNLISVGTPQRLMTTQASNTNTIVTSLGNAISKITNEQKSATATINTVTAQSQQISTQPRVITANQIQQITAQQLVNAKVLGKANMGGIRNLNIAHIRGKPVIIAKHANVAGQQTGQNVILQSPVNSTNLVIGGQALKVQGNVMSPANVQVLNQTSSSSQPQTVVLGNQILKVQPTGGIKTQTTQTTSIISSNISNINSSGGNHLTTIANTNAGTMVVNSTTNLNQTTGQKAVVLGSTGQTIRVQSPAQVQVQTASGAGSSQGQSMVLGTAVKGAALKNATTAQRVVLAVQGGGQIFLPPGFQSINCSNLKTLQGLKVVSIAQQPNKGELKTKNPEDDQKSRINSHLVVCNQSKSITKEARLRKHGN